MTASLQFINIYLHYCKASAFLSAQVAPEVVPCGLSFEGLVFVGHFIEP